MGQEKNQMMHEISVTAPVRRKSLYFPALAKSRVPAPIYYRFILLFVDFL